MTKRPMGHGDLRNMGNFKAVAIDYEYYLTLSDEPVSVCLTERQMYVLSVQNTYTAWLTRWYNTDDITQTTVQYIAAEIEELLMCGCGVPAPTLTDRLNSITYNNSTTTSYTTTQNTWTTGGQTVVSIAPQLDYATGNPTNIAKLTCAALRNLLNAIVAQGKQMNQQTADENEDTVNALSSAMGALSTAGAAAGAVGGGAAAVVGFFGGPWLVLGLALGAVGLKVATLFMTADPTVFDNAAAIEDVLCVMQNNTAGGNMTRSEFQTALTPNSFAPGSDQAKLAAMIQPYLDDLTMYLQFLSLGNQLYNVSDFAVLPDCGCGPDGCWYFLTSDAGVTPLASAAPNTNYVAGEGRKRDDYRGVPSRLSFYKALPVGTLKSVSLQFNEPIPATVWVDVRSWPGVVYKRTQGNGTRYMTVTTFNVTPNGGLSIDMGNNTNTSLSATLRVQSVCWEFV